MTTSGIYWITPPERLIENIEKYGERVLIAVHAVASYVGIEMANQGKLNATWEDRTGNARSGLFYAVDGFGLETVVGQVPPDAAQLNTDGVTVSGSAEELVIAFGHTVFYGKFLELSNGGRYAVVMSTIQQHLPMLENMLNDLFEG